jgi:hypothetical protein
VVRSSLFVRALGAAIGVPLLAGLTLGATPAHAATPAASPGQAEEPEPLAITIDTMSPSVVPRTGSITLTGTVTNVDTETWSTISLYPFISDTPMTTEAELRAAVDVPVSQDVGQRIFRDVPLDEVAELAPGESYDYTIVVPRSLYSVPSGGVYWFGVHALAEGPIPRDQVADGRVRTFLPYVPANAQGEIETALVIPLRRHVAFGDDGSVAHVEDWEQTLSDGGRLRALVELGAAAGSSPVTWLIDPALPDVVRRLAAGNPARSLDPTLPPDAEEEPEGEQSDEPSPSVALSTPPDAEDDPDDELEPEEAAVAETASEWLADLRSALFGNQVLALPYGDLDVAAAADHDTGLFDLAVARTGAVLASWDVSTMPAIGSPSGYLDPDAIALASSATTTLLTDRMFGDDPPAVADTGRERLVVLSSGAAEGGPRPGDRLAGIALRQRIVSEAAIRMLDTGDRPLVMMLPLDWQPDDLDGFFSGLQLDWLDLSTVSEATDRPAAVVDPSRLTYPERQARRELRAANFETAEDLIDAGRRLETILTRNDQVSATVTDQALTSTSYAAREAPRAARAATRESQEWIESRLKSVTVDAPVGVTLSGSTGSFLATVTNDLDQPVTVVVTAASDDGIEVTDSEPLQLAADSQATVSIDVHTRRSGVHDVTLYLSNVDGDRLGSLDSVPIRSAQVSTVIWVIMASGAGILFLAVAARLVRRFRHRNDPDPEPQPQPDPQPEPAT